MKVTLSLSVVALVAGQGLYGGFGGYGNPFSFGFGYGSSPYPQAPLEQTSVCRLQGETNVCCVPLALGGCNRGGLPSPSFLNAVCCPAAQECCPSNQFARQPVYNCCAEGEGCTVGDDGVGTCEPGDASITIEADSLDGSGRCPDGALPTLARPGVPFQCSLNVNVPNSNVCPTNHVCVKDLNLNINTGVCCPTTGCGERKTCNECVTGIAPIPDGPTDAPTQAPTDAPTLAPTDAPTRAPTERNPFFPPLRPLPDLPRPNFPVPSNPLDGLIDPTAQPCDWLSEGDLYSGPSCVAGCDNFPTRSCVRFGQPQACPTSDGGETGLIVNTGTCNRRCGSIGTGRGAKINNVGNSFVEPVEEPIQCCSDFPGDYCCDTLGGLQPHCVAGRVPGGPICGIIVRGTALDPNVQNGFGAFAGPGFNQYPFGFGFRPIFREGEATGEEINSEEDENRQFFLFPGNFYRPRPFTRPSNPSSVPPSATVCSCDESCGTYQDCCSDYFDTCAIEVFPGGDPIF